jgi:hypothetical protein
MDQTNSFVWGMQAEWLERNEQFGLAVLIFAFWILPILFIHAETLQERGKSLDEIKVKI